jgi:uncharacterized membrane protein YhiD involved in acid resistance
MEYIVNIANSEVFQIVFKLILSSLLAGIIGIERSAFSKPAGLVLMLLLDLVQL